MTTKTISGGVPGGYVLASKYSYVSVTNTGSVGGAGLGLHSSGQSGVNLGTLYGVISTKHDALALDNDVGGSFINLGSINGYWGVKGSGDSVNLENDGSISGIQYGVNLQAGGTITNVGVGATIYSFGTAVDIAGGAGDVVND